MSQKRQNLQNGKTQTTTAAGETAQWLSVLTALSGNPCPKTWGPHGGSQLAVILGYQSYALSGPPWPPDTDMVHRHIRIPQYPYR